jgi:hypothetical protein
VTFDYNERGVWHFFKEKEDSDVPEIEEAKTVLVELRLQCDFYKNNGSRTVGKG